MTTYLESLYDLEDERPRNHGGRYIPTLEEVRQMEEYEIRLRDHEETEQDKRSVGWPV